MFSQRHASVLAFCLGAMVVVTIVRLVPLHPDQDVVAPIQQDRWEVWTLLARLEQECSPDSPANDYAWSSNAPPTERHRREMMERLHELGPEALAEVQARMEKPRADEFGEMLVVIAAALGDDAKVEQAAKLMAYSGHPAVRLIAARELKRLRDPRTIEWFDYAALNDDRVVRNDACGRTVELFYPVRTTAQLALRDMGIEFKTEGERRREKQALEEQIKRQLIKRALDEGR